MKRLGLLLFAVAALAVLVPPLLAQNAAAVPRITVAELKKLQAAGAVTVVDVRDPESFRAGHIPGALSIPEEQLAASVGKLKNAKKPIVTYCA